MERYSAFLTLFSRELSDEGKPITKKAYKKLQKEKEKAERKAATAAKLAAEKAERDANNVVSLSSILQETKRVVKRRMDN